MTEPTARERLAEKLCEAAVHMHLVDENASWQAMWLRVADVALTEVARELRAAAQEAVDSGYILRLDSGVMFDVLTAEQLRARADALEADE